MRKKYLLMEDDCAPDGLAYFKKKLLKQFGMTTEQFRKDGVYKESEDGLHLEWQLNGYILSFDGDDPFYKLEKEEA